MSAATPLHRRWQARAPKRPPMALYRLTHLRLTSLLTEALDHRSVDPKSVADVGYLLRGRLPCRVLTALLKDVTAAQGHDMNPVNLLRLNLAADVTHLEIKGRGMKAAALLGGECEALMQEVECVKELHLECLHLEDVALQPGLLSCILRRVPRLRSLHVSGGLAAEALNHLRRYPCTLHSLHLHSCCVSDEEIASALVWPQLKLSYMAEMICSDEDLAEPGRATASSLKHLTIISPLLTVAGAVVLLRALPHLHYLHYTWLVPVCESLRLLQQLCPSVTSYAITHLELSLVTADVLASLASLCPGLRSLQMEGTDPSVVSLDGLAGFTGLTSLSCRMVAESLVVSALREVGHSLLELRVEYEECVRKLFSFAALRSLQQYCRDLRSLELISVCLSEEVRPRRGRQPAKTLAPAFPELTRLVVEGAAASPDVLLSLIGCNRALEQMSLVVNQDALTDHMVTSLLSQNDLPRLATLHLGAGSLSSPALTALLALPALATLSLNLKHFTHIPEATFTALQEDLRSGNCLCRLERSDVE